MSEAPPALSSAQSALHKAQALVEDTDTSLSKSEVSPAEAAKNLTPAELQTKAAVAVAQTSHRFSGILLDSLS